jgi:hypothetical protein
VSGARHTHIVTDFSGEQVLLGRSFASRKRFTATRASAAH